MCEILAACHPVCLHHTSEAFELAWHRTPIQWPGVEPEPMAPLPRLENALTAAVAATLRGIRMTDAAAGQRREGSALVGRNSMLMTGELVGNEIYAFVCTIRVVNEFLHRPLASHR